MRSFRLPLGVRNLCYGMVGLGVVAFIIGLNVDPERLWANFLLEYYFWLCISLGGVFFVALQHITGSTWSVPIRRVPEVFVGYLPVAAILFIVLLFGVPTLYEWSNAEIVAHDPILQDKAAYLNVPFFVIRQILLFVLCGGAGWWMLRNTLRQDKSGDPKLTKLNVKIAAPFILIFAWAFSFFGIDMMMSLAPHWFSTIFGIYCWAGLFCSALAMMTIGVILLRKGGYFGDHVTPEHYHGLGKLMFAFSIFWSYIAFSQFMLIWYANLPEETPYMILRVSGDWKAVSIALMIVKFWVPLFMLISQGAKRNENYLLFVACYFIGAQWLDVYWLVFPNFFTTPIFSWMEICLFAGFAGLFILSVTKLMSRVPLVAEKDPWLEEGRVHHQ